MVNRLETTLTLCLLLLLAATLPACSSEADRPTPGTGTGSVMTFKFNIYTSDRPESRAPGVWEEPAANVAERILSIDDFRVLVFNQSGELLTRMSPSSLDYVGDETVNDGYYNLRVSFSHDYFDKFTDEAVVPFTVMIMANLNSAGGEYIDYPAGETKVADVREDFLMPANFVPTPDSGIPMYGINSFAITKSQLMLGADAPFAGDIDMIRSLCKIEIADAISNSAKGPDGILYPHVTGVEMVSWNAHGYLRPAHDSYSAGLTEANIFPAAPVANIAKGIPVDGKYRFYCPEAKSADMTFRVAAVLEPGGETRFFTTSLDTYASAIGSELVRNHIYRFDVNAVNTMADLHIEVSDWSKEISEFELNNTVSMEPNGFLRWTYDDSNFAVSTETYNGMPEEQLSILNGTSAYATGHFYVISPIGATWRSYFIPGENGVDAFEFVDVDADGNVVDGSARVYAEGNVGEPAVIHIRGKGTADSYRHWAELVVEVRTVDGLILHVPLTTRMSTRFVIYRENRM